MAPIPLDGLTMWGMFLLSMLPFLMFVILGILTWDTYQDNKKAKEVGDPDAYVMEWRQVVFYGIGATLFTMASLGAMIKDLEANLITAALAAWVMGLVFQMILPQIIEIAGAKVTAVVQAILK